MLKNAYAIMTDWETRTLFLKIQKSHKFLNSLLFQSGWKFFNDYIKMKKTNDINLEKTDLMIELR